MKQSTSAYVTLEITLGLSLLLSLSIWEYHSLQANLVGVVFLALLGVVAESQSLAIDDNKAISIAFAIDISALFMFGLASAAWVSFATAFFSIMDYGRGRKEHVFNTPIYKSLFNASNYILSILAAGYVYMRLGGTFLHQANLIGLEANFVHIVAYIPVIFLSLITYVLVNTVILAVYFLFAARHQRNIFAEWLKIFRWSVISMFCIGTLGVLLTIVYGAFGIVAVLLFFLPFLMFRYAYAGFTSVQKGYLDTIKAFSAALEAKDKYTIGHARRVEKYCGIIADEMNLSAERTKTLKYASLLHDIGKIGISEAILNKNDRLDEAERIEIQRHPVIGAQMLEEIQFLKREVKIIRAHHVFYNGQGYPSDAQAESQMLESQILCAADSFDAMTSDRAYRRALPLEVAIGELEKNSGTQFNPEVVKAFIRGLEKITATSDTPLLERLRFDTVVKNTGESQP